jgi:hypothetical protein
MCIFSPSYKLAQSGTCSLLIFDYHILYECYFDVHKLMSDVYYIIRYRVISGWTLDKLHSIAVGILNFTIEYYLVQCYFPVRTESVILKTAETVHSLKNWTIPWLNSSVEKSNLLHMLVCDHLIKNHSALARSIQCIQPREKKSLVLVSSILRSSTKSSVIF